MPTTPDRLTAIYRELIEAMASDDIECFGISPEIIGTINGEMVRKAIMPIIVRLLSEAQEPRDGYAEGFAAGIEEAASIVDCGGCKGVARLKDGSCIRSTSSDCYEVLANEIRALPTGAMRPLPTKAPSTKADSTEDMKEKDMSDRLCIVCGKKVPRKYELAHLRSNHLGPHRFWFDAREYQTMEPSLTMAEIKQIVGCLSGYQAYEEREGGDIPWEDGVSVALTHGPHFYARPPATTYGLTEDMKEER